MPQLWLFERYKCRDCGASFVKRKEGVRQRLQSSFRTELGLLVYGRYLKPRPVQKKALQCTGSGYAPVGMGEARRPGRRYNDIADRGCSLCGREI